MKAKFVVFVVVVLAIVILADFFTRNRMASPVKGTISSPFGNRIHPISGGEKFHNGIDIAAPSGTPIISPTSGKVISRYWSDLGGNSVVVERKDGLKTGFAHLSKFNIEQNQDVRAGRVIGYVGSTGNSTGPHLHFTVRDKSGKYLDPQKLII